MKKNLKRATASILTSALVAGICATGMSTEALAATEHWNDASTEAASWTKWKENWDAYSSDYENVSLTPGVDETELNLAWYSKTSETPKVKIATKEDMSDGQEYEGKQETAVVISEVQYYSNKVTVKNLNENTQYYYQVWKNGAWSEIEEYSTKSFSGFSFLYVGDPQIGASKGQTSEENQSMSSGSNNVTTTAEANLAARNDSYNWNEVLKDAVADHENVSFIVSAGDQVNYAKNEREYAGYLGAEALRSLPVATTIGNHDSGSNQYSLHYNNPNTQSGEAYTAGQTAAGTDYYYTYGNVLFIVLDTNNYNCATHENVIKKAIEENKDAKWRVVTFHQDIYGSGLDHSDSDGMVLRTQLTPIFDKYDIDVVLQGHDHTYSRTYQLQGDGQEHTAYNSSNYKSDENFKAQNNCYEIVSDVKSGTVVNPQGTVYLEANSATGSKFYNLIPQQQNFIAERSQTWTPTYSVIDVTEDTFTVTAYDATNGREMAGSSSYTIVKKAEAADTVITGTPSYVKTLGDKAFTLDVKADSDGALTYESDNEDVAVVSKSGKVTLTGVGTAKITVTAAATETKKEAVKEITVTVKEAEKPQPQLQAQSIQAPSSITKAYGAKAFSLNAKASGTLTYTSSNTKVVSVSAAGKVTVKGTGKAVITVKAAATDTFKAASKNITITVQPKKQTVSLSNKTKGQLKITWKHDSKASGYQVVYATNKSFTKNVTTVTVKKNTVKSYTAKGLAKGKTYYVKVRAYKTADGKKIYGSYSTVKNVKVK